MIFCACASESEPPNTVKSLENTKTVRPLIVPQPVTTPSPGIFVLLHAEIGGAVLTNMSNSSNEPVVEQEFDALARRELAALVLGLDALLAAAERAPARGALRACRGCPSCPCPSGCDASCIARAVRRNMRAHRKGIRPVMPAPSAPHGVVATDAEGDDAMLRPGCGRARFAFARFNGSRRDCRESPRDARSTPPARSIVSAAVTSARRAARRSSGQVVLAPLRDVPVLVDMRGRPGGVEVEALVPERERHQRRAGDGGDRLSAPSRHGSSGQRRARGGERGRRLLDEHHALRQHEARAELVARPAHAPDPNALACMRDQSRRAAGAIEHQIRARGIWRSRPRPAPAPRRRRR